MRPSATLSVWAPLLLAGSAQAQMVLSQQQPTVVYEGRGTISAQPYYKRLERSDTDETGGAVRVAAPTGAGILALEDRLPLSPTHLSVGNPGMRTVPGLITPLFIMGMDEVSLTWFARAVEGLADIGARGIVVQASDRSAWRDLHSRARKAGIDLMLLDGDAIAAGYGISTYPSVLMSPALAGRGAHE